VTPPGGASMKRFACVRRDGGAIAVLRAGAVGGTAAIATEGVTMRKLVLSASCVVLLAGTAAAVTPPERCKAFELTGAGKRILAKLRCRAKAKMQGTAVDAACLDRAEKRFVLHVAKAGNDCLDPDKLVALGAKADAEMSGIVEDLDPDAAQIPDLSGTWQTRTIVSIDPNGGVSLDCQYYPPGHCPTADLLAITDCTTTVVQNGTSMTQTSTCSSPPDSPVQLGTFPQSASGTVDLLTGEWTLSGTVQPAGFPVYVYSSEGVYSPDGQSMTGFSTAGLVSGESLFLASTSGHRVP
jgi:hypothetical protein